MGENPNIFMGEGMGWLIWGGGVVCMFSVIYQTRGQLSFDAVIECTIAVRILGCDKVLSKNVQFSYLLQQNVQKSTCK